MKITNKTNSLTLAFRLNPTGARNRLTVYKFKKKVIKTVIFIYGCHYVLKCCLEITR